MLNDHLAEHTAEEYDINTPLCLLFEDMFNFTYNNQKFDNTLGHSVFDQFKGQTGISLKNNLIPNLAIIDIDKSLDESVRNGYISKLSINDDVVKFGSGGLHINCVHDGRFAH